MYNIRSNTGILMVSGYDGDVSFSRAAEGREGQICFLLWMNRREWTGRTGGMGKEVTPFSLSELADMFSMLFLWR